MDSFVRPGSIRSERTPELVGRAVEPPLEPTRPRPSLTSSQLRAAQLRRYPTERSVETFVLDDERRRLLNALEHAIIEMRYRIRYDNISIDEIHDMLDAIHNVPGFIRCQSDWHTFDRIRESMAICDRKWKPDTNPDHTGRRLTDVVDRPIG